MSAPDLKQIIPKTITSIGKFNGTLNLFRIFDIVPLSETESFRVVRIKYEGLVRDVERGETPVESGTEFKNSITVEINDKEFDKIKAVKINCEGIHMCGNRSIERSRAIADYVANLISDTNAFIDRSVTWEAMLDDPYYPKMENMIRSILPATPTEESKQLLVNFFRDISVNGGLYQLKTKLPNQGLKIDELRPVMVNYGYGPYQHMQEKTLGKEIFLRNLVQRVLLGMQGGEGEFDIRLDYDSHISSLGWSGSVPLKFVHRKTGQVQWITLQLRRGTIVHSGPNVEIMQKAVEVLFKLLF